MAITVGPFFEIVVQHSAVEKSYPGGVQGLIEDLGRNRAPLDEGGFLRWGTMGQDPVINDVITLLSASGLNCDDQDTECVYATTSHYKPPKKPRKWLKHINHGPRECELILLGPEDGVNDDSFDLDRFVQAQQDTYDLALSELEAGQKESHWMWFIFPQVKGLANSDMSLRYAITDIKEARAYLKHPVLGLRLQTCAKALLSISNLSALDILGYPDDLKLKSSMTLFAFASSPESVFAQVINQYFNGEFDQKTIHLLADGK